MAKRSTKKRAADDEVFTQAVGKVAPAPSLPSGLSRDWLWGLILLGAVIVTYQPVWHAGFVWDDDLGIIANPCIVGPLGLKDLWTTSAADICPLTVTTFWVEHALWGWAPLPYHLVNIFMHGACAIALWQVLQSLRVPGAWLGAALWALHPVQVESVAWITEMKNTQSGLFYLLSILFFVRWVKAKNLDGRSGGGWNYGLTLLFAALAMASKSSTVVLPVILCLCAWWIKGRWRWRNLARVVPMFVMAFATSALSIWTQGLQLATITDPQFARTWPQRLAAAGDAVWFYLGKLLWPYPLIAVYPRWQIEAGQWFSYLPLLAVIVVLVALWIKQESWSRPCFFVLTYFVAALLPVLGFVDGYFWRYSLVGDHFQYLADMGPLALAGAGLAKLADFAISRRPWLRSSLCAGLLLILGTLSWQRTWAFESNETLWTDTLAKNPNCWMAHYNLGIIYIQKGQVDEAIAEYQKALEIDHTYAEAHNNLGNALLQKGRVDKAIEQYQRALEIKPNYADAHYNLGNALFQKGQVDDAIAQYQEALEMHPNDAQTHYNLGIALLQKGQVDDAMTQYKKALEINPNYAEAYNNLGIALAKKGHVDEAIVEFQKALRLKPDYTPAQQNLAKAQAMTPQTPASK